MSATFSATFVDPDNLLRQLTLVPGSVVADFGCGSGYFSLAFAKALGKNGKVVSLDILPSSLDAVASRAKQLGITTLSTKRVNLEREKGSGLDVESVDWVILKDILFQNNDKLTILKEAHRILRIGGHVLLMEWKNDHATVGPETSMRMSETDLLTLISSSGFKVEKELSVGDFHYAFMLTK